jgi:hypothetical protein
MKAGLFAVGQLGENSSEIEARFTVIARKGIASYLDRELLDGLLRVKGPAGHSDGIFINGIAHGKIDAGNQGRYFGAQRQTYQAGPRLSIRADFQIGFSITGWHPALERESAIGSLGKIREVGAHIRAGHPGGAKIGSILHGEPDQGRDFRRFVEAPAGKVNAAVSGKQRMRLINADAAFCWINNRRG